MQRPARSWFSRGVAGIGGASFPADLGHEVPTALLPTLLTATLHAPASALGLIEGIFAAAAGLANFKGSALADDPGCRRRVAVGGYSTTAVLSAAIAAAAARWQAGVLRSGAWAVRWGSGRWPPGSCGRRRTAQVAGVVMEQQSLVGPLGAARQVSTSRPKGCHDAVQWPAVCRPPFHRRGHAISGPPRSQWPGQRRRLPGTLRSGWCGRAARWPRRG
jgi:hypothetical protein